MVLARRCVGGSGGKQLGFMSRRSCKVEGGSFVMLFGKICWRFERETCCAVSPVNNSRAFVRIPNWIERRSRVSVSSTIFATLGKNNNYRKKAAVALRRPFHRSSRYYAARRSRSKKVSSPFEIFHPLFSMLFSVLRQTSQTNAKRESTKGREKNGEVPFHSAGRTRL